MKLVFVMDIMNGFVVLAERGERQKYRPLAERSLIIKESDPFKVLEFIKPRFLYVADLDRILGKGENMETLKSLSPMVEEMIADCGFRSFEELEQINFIPVLGTETFDITKLSNTERDCYVSFDFREELFLDASGRFRDFRNALDFLNSLSVRGIILLNMARVGSGKVDFNLLEEFLSFSEHPVYLGGGVGGMEDLEMLKDLGCAGVLLSTAVHKKKVPVDLIQTGFI